MTFEWDRLVLTYNTDPSDVGCLRPSKVFFYSWRFQAQLSR